VIFSLGCQNEQHIQGVKKAEGVIKLNNGKQITFDKQHRLGCQEEQPLLFSLVT